MKCNVVEIPSFCVFVVVSINFINDVFEDIVLSRLFGFVNGMHFFKLKQDSQLSVCFHMVRYNFAATRDAFVTT